MYSVSYSCRNCGHRWEQKFEQGMSAPSTIICPRCGCFDGVKTIGTVDWPQDDWPKKPVPRQDWRWRVGAPTLWFP